MKKIKSLWKKYQTAILVEIMVVVVMLILANMIYKLTYEMEYQKVLTVDEKVGELEWDVNEDDRKASDFLMHLSSNILDAFWWNNMENKYCGYGLTWEIYDEDYNILEQSTDNNLMMVWSPKGDGENEESYKEKAYLIEKYFTDEEMAGVWKFYFSSGNKYTRTIEIDKVVGYYNDNKEFVPVEIQFVNPNEDEDSKNRTYSLKSEENRNKEGTVYVTRRGTAEGAEYHIVDEEGVFWISYIKKKKESVNKAIEEVKENEYNNINENGYYYAGHRYLLSVDINEDMISKEEQSEEKWLKIALCADLKYMTLNNTMFKRYLIIEVILCQLIGIGIIYIITKNNERRKYLDSMKYTFINAMAHEMKTPSAVIVNSVECIEDGVKPEKQIYYLDKVKKEGLHMNRLLLDMLTYTKLTDADRRINKEEINMKELFKEVIEHYTDAIEKKNIDVQWDISSESTIMADRKLMEMVVDNYLSNAVKYCKNSGIIKITMDRRNVVVANNGDSIHPTKLDVIWEPLYVIDESRKNREGSSGMGLAISAKIMDLHGMKYGARNTVDGVEFYIKIS